MFKGKSILAIITARGGSKGLPKKNIRPLLGKPLIGWTIEQAQQSKYLDKTIVSTDDREIAAIAREFGGDVPFIRPPELATDEAKSIDVVFHALDFCENEGLKFDYCMILQPTSPLRAEGDIDMGIQMLVDNMGTADSLVSVGEVLHGHPYIIQKTDKEGFLIPFCDINSIPGRRQELHNAYVPYGVIFISKAETLRKQKTFYQEKTLPYLINRWQHYEIDDIYDFMEAEMILKSRLEENDETIR